MVTGQEAGYTLDRSPVHHSLQLHTGNITLPKHAEHLTFLFGGHVNRLQHSHSTLAHHGKGSQKHSGILKWITVIEWMVWWHSDVSPKQDHYKLIQSLREGIFIVESSLVCFACLKTAMSNSLQRIFWVCNQNLVCRSKCYTYWPWVPPHQQAISSKKKKVYYIVMKYFTVIYSITTEFLIKIER